MVGFRKLGSRKTSRYCEGALAIGVKAGSKDPLPHVICRSRQPMSLPRDTSPATFSSPVPPALTQRRP